MAKKEQGASDRFAEVIAQALAVRKNDTLKQQVQCGKELVMLLIWLVVWGVQKVEKAPQSLAAFMVDKPEAIDEVLSYFEQLKGALDEGLLESLDIAWNMEGLTAKRNGEELWVRFCWNSLDLQTLQSKCEARAMQDKGLQ